MGKYSKKPVDYQAEDTELEEAYSQIADPAPAKSGKRRTIIIISICAAVLLLAACALGGYFYFFHSSLEDGIIMNGVSIAGVDVGGMTKEDARSALNLAIGDSYSEKPMVITILDETVELTPELTGVSFDYDAAIEAAYALGRGYSRSERQAQQLEAATSGIQVDMLECLNLDTEVLYAALQSLCKDFGSTLTQTTYEITGAAPDLSSEEEPTELQTLVITMGTPEFPFDLDDLYDQVLAAYQSNTMEVEYQCEVTMPDPIDLDALYEQTTSEAVEPEIDFETMEVSAHAYGYSFDLEAAKLAVEEAGYGEAVEIPFTVTAPTQTKEVLAAMLFRDELATYTAYQASSSNRATNLRLACEAINGTILMPGDTFDYNEVVGERTPERGYKTAAAYMGNETITTYGGGVCQPSSVIYYCALMADLEIVTRHCHTFASSYVPLGMDATVSWGGPEFRFRNNTDYPIRIDAAADGGSVTITLVGTDLKDYYVKMEYEVWATYGWEEETVKMTAAEAKSKGYSDGEVITTPYTGYKVQTYKCKYSKEDDSLIERTEEALSVYSSRNRRVVKIQKDKEETEATTAPTTEPTTEPTTAPTTEPTTAPPETTTAPPETTTAPPEEDGGHGGNGNVGEA